MTDAEVEAASPLVPCAAARPSAASAVGVGLDRHPPLGFPACGVDAQSKLGCDARIGAIEALAVVLLAIGRLGFIAVVGDLDPTSSGEPARLRW
jgi:hypothetical protein